MGRGGAMLAGPSCTPASGAWLSSDTYSHSELKTLPTRVGLGRSEFVRCPPACRTRPDRALRHADESRGFHGRWETLTMMVGASLVVDRRAKADFCVDGDLLHRAVVVPHDQRDIDPIAD